jgi:hypothetical protein
VSAAPRVRETKALLVQQRDRARDLVRWLTEALRDEHNRRCECGKPSCGDCRTQMLIGRANQHVALWAASRGASDTNTREDR